jgi:hypothetical protein
MEGMLALGRKLRRVSLALALLLTSADALARDAALLSKPPVAEPPPRMHVRDFERAPVVVVHTPAGAVYAVSDLHGNYRGTFELFRKNGLVSGDPSEPGRLVWTGGDATLVVVGDILDYRNGSVDLIDMLRALQTGAARQGGKVIVTMGNHETAFLSHPSSERATRHGAEDYLGRWGASREMEERGIDPMQVAGGTDAEGRGAWLRSLPFAARVGDTFFVHSGNTGGMTEVEMEAKVRAAVTRHGYSHDIIDGEASSLLGTEDWKVTAAGARANAAALGVQRIVMGHDHDALDGDGGIARTDDGVLIKIDTGFGQVREVGPARMLLIDRQRQVHQLDENAKRVAMRKYRLEGRISSKSVP